MADARSVSALHGLFYPLDRQMLSQSTPVRRFEVVCQEMESVIEHSHTG